MTFDIKYHNNVCSSAALHSLLKVHDKLGILSSARYTFKYFFIITSPRWWRVYDGMHTVEEVENIHIVEGVNSSGLFDQIVSSITTEWTS